MAKPNFTPGVGGLATNRYDFESHIEGLAFRHNAIQIDVNPAVFIAGVPYITVADALNAIGAYISFDELTGQGFIAVGDGYDTYHNADGNPNYDPTVPSLDTLLNPIFTLLLNYYNNPNATTLANVPIPYLRIKDGGVILIKAGTYTIKNTVVVPPGFILMGEGFGTKIVNQTSPAAPLFSVKPDSSLLNGYRQVDVGVTSGVADPNGIFMAARDTVFYNMIIADNFVEPKQSGDVTYLLPQNLPVIIGPTNTVQITNVSNASPIEITTSGPHGLSTGNSVIVGNVSGNTAADAAWVITVIDSTHFTLNGSTGNGSYTSGTGQVYAFPYPLISQQEGSSLIVDKVKFVGKVEYQVSPYFPLTVTGTAIATDSTTPQSSGSSLTITNSIFDGFIIPINFTASGNVNDRLSCVDNKIRAFGTASTSADHFGQNLLACPIQMNTCSAKVVDNSIFTDYINTYTVFFFGSYAGVTGYPGPTLVSIRDVTFPYWVISSVTNTSPIEITTSTINTLVNGQAVTISGVGGNTAANGIWNITVLDNTHFTLNGSTGNGTWVSSPPGTVFAGERKMNIQVAGNNVTSVASNLKPTPYFYPITYQPFNLAGSSLLASSINYSIYGNTNNVNANLISPVAYKTVSTGTDSFYSFTGDETIILVENIVEISSVSVNLPEASSVPGRILTIKNVMAPGIAATYPTLIVPWGPSFSVANTSGTGVQPITIYTTLPHNLANGTLVTITGVNGNTNANGQFTITVTGSNSFTLNGTPAPTGNGTYIGGGIVYATDLIEGAQLPYSMIGDYQVVRLISDGAVSWWII
jgi:hypothetical protein